MSSHNWSFCEKYERVIDSRNRRVALERCERCYEYREVVIKTNSAVDEIIWNEDCVPEL